MDFVNPWPLLLLIAAVPVVPVVARRSLVGLAPRQRRLATALRLLLVCLLIIAAAGPRLHLPARGVAGAVVIDVSASMRPAMRAAAREAAERALGARGRGDTATVVTFARTPELSPARGAGPAADAASDAPLLALPELAGTAAEATDIGRALEFAAGILPADRPRRLLLLSDGGDTTGGALAAANRLAALGVAVLPVPPPPSAEPEALIERVAPPPAVRAGEPFRLAVTVGANGPTAATLDVFRQGFRVATRPLILAAGSPTVELVDLEVEGRYAVFELALRAERDTMPQNNRYRLAVAADGPAKALLIDREPERLRVVADLLRAAGFAVEVRPPTGVPATAEDLQAVDLLVLSDVPATAIDDRRAALFDRWVTRFGGGLLMVGGDNSFGAGGYYRTPVESLLPVRCLHDDREENPTVALLVVLDRSGSMAAAAEGQPKIALASRGAIQAAELLRARDWFGLIAVDTRPHTVIPLARVGTRGGFADRSSADRILSLAAAGGGISIYTALAEAARILGDSTAAVRHAIVFADAADIEEKILGEAAPGAAGAGSAFDLAAALAAARITLSVVALGHETDRDAAFLRQLAERGGGRFYLTADALSVPKIFSAETLRVAGSSLLEQPLVAVPKVPSPVTADLDWSGVPPLLGCNRTKAKPTAETLLATAAGDPLLVTWRAGIGRAGAFTADLKGRWTADWLGRPEFAKFLARLVRVLARTPLATGLEVAVGGRPVTDPLAVEVAATDADGLFRDGLALTAVVAADDAPGQPVPLRQTGPGRYAAELPQPAAACGVVAVVDGRSPDEARTIAWSRGYPAEYGPHPDQAALLRAVAAATGGRMVADPAELFAPAAVPVRRPVAVAPLLLAAALVLLPVELFVRRVASRRGGR